MVANRTLPAGAEASEAPGVDFRVWAPLRKRVEVVLESGPGAPAEIELAPDDGYFPAFAAEAAAGTRYRYRLDGGRSVSRSGIAISTGWAARFFGGGRPVQRFAWTDAGWQGVRLEGQVIYEMHIGTFTDEGTWDAARRATCRSWPRPALR